MSVYDMVYMVTNVFGAYIIYRFMRIFFDRTDVNRIVELISYIVYALFIGAIYLFVNIPVITLISNILAFIALSYNYKSSIKKRILSITLIYLVLMCVEIIVVFISGYFDFSIFTVNKYSSIFGFIFSKILSFFVVLILGNYKSIKNGISIPISNWLCIFLIPFSSLYIILTLFQAGGLPWTEIMISIILILLINFAAFYLYDTISMMMNEKVSKVLFEQQSLYYNKQFKDMETSVKASNAIKHDLKNHLSIVYMLAENGQTQKALNHIEKMISASEESINIANTGNMDIDSILNFKLHEAEQKNIEISLDISVPEEIGISSFDMVIVLGNLLDNAIKAVMDLIGNRYINIMIKYDKGRVIIKVDNPFKGELLKEGDVYLTTQRDKELHGIGLQSVKNTVKKYNGTITIDHEDGIFSVLVLMYVQ